MERFCRPLPYHLATRTAETAGLPKPTRSIRPKPRVSAGIFVGTCHQAGALVQLTPGSPQARAPDPIVDLTAGPLEPGLEARVVSHLVVDPRGDEVELPPADETACPRTWSIHERSPRPISTGIASGSATERESSAEGHAAPARERMSARNRSRCSVISRIVAGGATVW